MKYRVLFYGTPNFSIPFLKALFDDKNFEVVGVVTEADRPAGRGKQLRQTAIAEFVNSCVNKDNIDVISTEHKRTEKSLDLSTNTRDDKMGSSLSSNNMRYYSNINKIPIFKPEKVSHIKSKLLALKADVAVVVAYGQIIPDEMLSIPKYNSINVHPSDLPKYRGPAPIQAALLHGDTSMKVSIMKMDKKMDHGPIIDKLKINIEPDDNYFSLEEKILDKSPAFLVQSMKKYLTGKISPKKQDDSTACYTKMIDKKDGLINWNKSDQEIHNQIRAYSAWPKAYSMLADGKRLIFLKSSLTSGKIKPILVQLEGKKPTEWNNFINGYKKLLPKELTNRLL